MIMGTQGGDANRRQLLAAEAASNDHGGEPPRSGGVPAVRGDRVTTVNVVSTRSQSCNLRSQRGVARRGDSSPQLNPQSMGPEGGGAQGRQRSAAEVALALALLAIRRSRVDDPRGLGGSPGASPSRAI